MNEIMSRVFQNRGYNSEFFEENFFKRHALPKDTDRLCSFLDTYRVEGKFLVIFTDFDMDGICSGVIALAGLSEFGIRAGLFFPDVSRYGFDVSDVDNILLKYPDVCGILTGDVGITSLDAISYAKSKGLDVFVTDHHISESTVLPGTVTVDPNRVDDLDGYGNICGANVMYQVLRHYATNYMPSSGYYSNQIDRLRVFVGIATISDAMYLYCENRAIVRDAISICRMFFPDRDFQSDFVISGTPVYKSVFYGIYSILLCFFNLDKIKTIEDINENFFGYYIAPAFNSLKRMGISVQLAYDVFFNPSKSVAAMKKILKYNDERKVLVNNEFDVLCNQGSFRTEYIYLSSAASGILGLLCQKMISITGFPVFVLNQHSDGSYSGSGRCPDWFPFITLTNNYLGNHPDEVSLNAVWTCAGHNSAFGIFIPNDAALDALVEFLTFEIPKKSLSVNIGSDVDTNFDTDLVIGNCDGCEFGFESDLFIDYLSDLESWRPFGSGFPEPVFCLKFLRSDAEFCTLSDGLHLRVDLPSGFRLLCFSQGFLLPKGKSSSECFDSEIVARVKVSMNYFRGVSTVQFVGDIVSGFVLHEERMILE